MLKLFKSINKYDALILIISLGAAFALSAIFFISGRGAEQGGFARVSVNGSALEDLPLSEDAREFRIAAQNGVLVLEIRGGAARMIYADCPDKSCVKQGGVSRGGQFIVCLPNRVVVEIIGKDRAAGVDAVTR